MSARAISFSRRRLAVPDLDTVGAWTLAIVWIAPLLFAVWAALHAPDAALSFDLTAPLTFENFRIAWAGAPWPRYLLNTGLLDGERLWDFPDAAGV